MQVRGEAINATNKVNLAPPNVSAVTTSFGQITSTSTSARIMQLGMKLLF